MKAPHPPAHAATAPARYSLSRLSVEVLANERRCLQPASMARAWRSRSLDLKSTWEKKKKSEDGRVALKSARA